jgi:Flp pilus assembly protein TadG
MNTIASRPTALPRRQAGAAAVEFALIVAATAIVLPATFVFFRVFWQYNVLRQATSDAARYMATVPVYQLGATSPRPVDVARRMVARAVVAAGILPASEEEAAYDNVVVYCPGAQVNNCAPRPDLITVTTSLNVTTPASLGEIMGGAGSWTFYANTSARYGN